MKRYFLVGIIIGAAAIYFGWTAFFNPVFDFDGSSGSSFTTEERYESLNGRHVASRYIESGGGAAGWCFRCVDVDGFEVFRIVPAQTELDIKWLDVKTLSITYEIETHTSTWRNQPDQQSSVAVVFNPIPGK